MNMMNLFKSRRRLIRVVTLSVALIAVLAGMVFKKTMEVKAYRLQIENSYQHSLDELCASAQNISVSLQKYIYATSPEQMSSISSDIIKNSTVAKSSLSLLPTGTKTLASLNNFFSQSGDYAAAISKKAQAGEEILDDDRNNIILLHTSAEKVSNKLNELMAKYEDGGLWTKEAESIIKKIDVEDSFENAVFELEDTFTDYPSLIYDGPFSDHMMKSSPKLLNEAENISAEEALSKASAFLNIPKKDFKRESDENGKIPCYRFSGTDFSISISKKGGYVVYYRKFKNVENEKINYDQAVEKAKDIAKKFSDASFESSYYFADEGICTVNLAYYQNGTICYTDLIKVGIALDSGELLFFESMGYLMNHTSRNIIEPKYTVQEAEKVLPKNVDVKSVKTALIPSPGSLKEFHCYEFLCNGINGQELLIYIDTQTLTEQDIILVMRTDGGTMTK